MRPDLHAVASDRPLRMHRRWVRRLLLAATLVVVVLGIVAMHQMAFGHDMTTSSTSSSAQGGHAAHDGPSEMLPMAAGHAGAHADAGTSGTGSGGACPDCADHQMAFGSCLLALTLLVLRWLLAPPQQAHVLPFLLPELTRLSRLATPFVVGRLIPPLSLAELSVLRT